MHVANTSIDLWLPFVVCWHFVAPSQEKRMKATMQPKQATAIVGGLFVHHQQRRRKRSEMKSGCKHHQAFQLSTSQSFSLVQQQRKHITSSFHVIVLQVSGKIAAKLLDF